MFGFLNLDIDYYLAIGARKSVLSYEYEYGSLVPSSKGCPSKEQGALKGITLPQGLRHLRRYENR